MTSRFTTALRMNRTSGRNIGKLSNNYYYQVVYRESLFPTYNNWIIVLVMYSLSLSIINPRRACAARVTVLGLSFCLSVFLSVCPDRYSGSTRD